jgi:SHS2 domain-containing protein
MVSSGYEELEHTADIALRAWGKDFFVLLKQSAKGMYELMGVDVEMGVLKKITFKIEKNGREMQLVDFLNEVLYLVEDENAKYETFSFKKVEDGIRVKASGYGVRSLQRNIKAVTFHNLAVEETDSGLEVSITFDV